MPPCLTCQALATTFAEAQASIKMVLGMAAVTTISVDAHVQVMAEPDFHSSVLQLFLGMNSAGNSSSVAIYSVPKTDVLDVHPPRSQ